MSGVVDDEAKGLPKTVVTEGGFGFSREYDAVKGWGQKEWLGYHTKC